MSLNRLGFALLILLYQAAVPLADPTVTLLSVGLWCVLSVAVFLHILAWPAVSHARRGAALLLDIGFLSWYLHIGGEHGSVLFPVYLWIVFGNGFRFGLVWLHAAMGTAMAGFTAVVLTTPFWRDQPHLAGGLLAGLLLLPLYAGVLIRKLSHARRAAEEANQAKSLFLANVSHELRTPLNAILGMGALLRGTSLDAEQRDMVRTMNMAARSLLELIDGVLDLSRIEAGRMPVRPEEVDLVDLLAEVRSMVMPQARAQGIWLGVHVASGTPPRVRTDRQHLKEILLNLAGNAVKFTQAGGVSIGLRGEPAAPGQTLLRFEVSDTGIGVAAAAHERIFESFTQADSGIVARFGGTGLGLAICRRLVRLLGGEIGIESRPGAGSTFWFTIEAETLAAAAPPPVPVLSNMLVLLLAGDAVTQRLRALLHGTGAVIRSVGSAREAAELLRARQRGARLLVAESRLLGLRPGEAAELAQPLEEALLPLLVLGERPGNALPRGELRWAVGALPADCSWPDLALALRVAGIGQQVQAAPVEVAEAVPRSAPARRMRVLVADDNAVNRKVATRILERAGHTVQLAMDGEAALDALEAAEAGGGPGFDIVLMDLNMPGMDGIEATKLYRFAALGGARRVPILGLTADATPEARARCLEAGMDGCLTKPVEPETLLETLEELVPPAAPPPPGPVAQVISHPRFQPPPPPPVQPEAIARIETLGGQAFVRDVAASFIAEAGDSLRRMAAAAAARDGASYRAHAHAMASGAANIGAQPLQALCRAAQRLGGAELAARGQAEAAAIATELERVVVALREAAGPEQRRG